MITKTPRLHVGQAITVGPLTLFPVWTDTSAVRNLRTGPAARVEVTELESGASVAALLVHNPGDWPVLLLEGELLEGGWQTRALVQDTILAPGESRVVPVACVEQNRWAGGSDHERRGRRAPDSVRSALRAQEPQTRVWDDVRRYDDALGAPATSSLADHLDRVPPVSALRPLPGQSGVIVGVASHPIALELFGSRSALVAHLPGIVDAATLEAMLHSRVERVPARRARRFADVVAAIEWKPATDAGAEVRWSGRSQDATLRALTFGDRIAHVAAVTA